MPHDIDEQYADNPALHQAREAHRVAVRRLGRVLHGTLAGTQPTLNDMLTAIMHNMPFLNDVCDARNAMLAASPEKDPQDAR